MKAKRAMIIACCVIIASLGIVLAGCGGGAKYADNPYVGTWASHIAVYQGVEVNVDDAVGAFEITLNADGSASMLEQGETIKGEWEPTSDGIKMVDATSEVIFTEEDGKLVTEESGVTFYFEKK